VHFGERLGSERRRARRGVPDRVRAVAVVAASHAAAGHPWAAARDVRARARCRGRRRGPGGVSHERPRIRRRDGADCGGGRRRRRYREPYIEWWADALPARRLGALAAALLLVGFALQSVQCWTAILDVPVR
jgi:hypothetical protein